MKIDFLERELKYLFINPSSNFSIEELEKTLKNLRYDIKKSVNTRQKFEEYYDDQNFTLLKRGDILRRTKHIWFDSDEITAPKFQYKRKVFNPNEPYATRREFGNDLTGLQEFVRSVKLDINPDANPKLTLCMIRQGFFLKSGKEYFFVVLDITTYTNPLNGESYTEKMIEIEDKANIGIEDMANIEHLKPEYDHHLRQMNDDVLSLGLPILITKENKYERGAKALFGYEKNE